MIGILPSPDVLRPPSYCVCSCISGHCETDPEYMVAYEAGYTQGLYDGKD